jgi:formylglycine-generating enzyme required for sulfatase activity/predicted Ser/Thr protein kinase
MALDCDLPEVEDIFQTALGMAPQEREAFLEQAAGENGRLRMAVARLLAAHARSRAIEARLSAVPGSLSSTHGAGAQDVGRRGRRIGGYILREVLGEGGMGVVYLAEQANPRRLVALKVLKGGLWSPSQLRRFRREAEILARLQHPGIAQVFEAGTALEDGVEIPFFAMERIQGLPLDRFVAANELSRDDRLRLLVRVSEAVDHAHRRGIVHRDLKPANILVDEAGQPKVLDFGVARVVAAGAAGARTASETGHLVGTVRYMSPEQFGTDPAAVDARADVYSLGVVLYEVLTGHLPHDLAGKMVHEAAAIIRDEPPVPLSGRNPRLQGDLHCIVHKAIEKEKERRYASAGALGDDIARFLADEPIEARPPALLYQAGTLIRRHRAFFAGLSAVLVVLVLGIVASTIFALREAKHRRLAEAHRDELLGLADAKRLADCRMDAESLLLWPQSPERLARVEGWLSRAAELSANLGLHRRRLASLSAREDGAPDVHLRRDLLSSLVTDIEDLFRPGSGLEPRLGLRLRAGRESRQAWIEAIRSIADRGECPLYGGMEIPVQDGLLPLGRDPRTGLWEFLAPHPGADPLGSSGGRVEDPLSQGVVLILVPGGSFLMGSDTEPSAASDEIPRHEVVLDPFFLSRYEVTQAQWRAVLGNAPSFFPGDRLPVESISWEEAELFCRAMGLELPTEAQWERACRAGTATRYSFGDDASPGDGNFRGREGVRIKTVEWQPLTVAVDSFQPNPFGFNNMHGNVAEWCADFLRGQFYSDPHSRRRNPVCTAPYDRWRVRVVRGGGYGSTAQNCRAAKRSSELPRNRRLDVGLRPARSLHGPEPDALLLRELLDRAEDLMDPQRKPRTQVADLEAWLRDGSAMAARLPEHEARLARMEGGGHRRGDPRRVALSELIAGVRAFLDPVQGLRVRMELLCELTRREEDLWEEALVSIADRERCPAYGGLPAAPQFGLTPLRREESGLWTFVHFLGLKVPPRRPDGRLDVERLALEEAHLRFVLIPGGELEMGPPVDEDDAVSGPRRRVRLKPFFISSCEIMEGEWQDVLGERLSPGSGGSRPATNVSGHDCLVFCQRTGLLIPTEAQWEHACRAGAGTPYANGSTLTPEDANFDALCVGRTPDDREAAPVDAFAPNAFGLYNVHGNAAEWCLESSDPDRYRLDSIQWVVRGGSWLSCARDCRAWSRRRALPGFRGVGNGFRPARAWTDPPD